ncbi:hypothetical protein HMPREF2533_00900 [Bacteroides fragilis]|nr:hypothetical protein HMPREF2530_00900 [Bacteroides fragilis]KXU49240.1 hypothetical protein HMPREF2533_00900 [Bacteroides fragilis]
MYGYKPIIISTLYNQAARFTQLHKKGVPFLQGGLVCSGKSCLCPQNFVY